MARFRAEVDTETLKKLVAEYLQEKLGSYYDANKVVIQVQSKQNYRVHEWEVGDFRAVVEGDL
jgi:hypothetical protein